MRGPSIRPRRPRSGHGGRKGTGREGCGEVVAEFSGVLVFPRNIGLGWCGDNEEHPERFQEALCFFFTLRDLIPPLRLHQPFKGQRSIPEPKPSPLSQPIFFCILFLSCASLGRLGESRRLPAFGRNVCSRNVCLHTKVDVLKAACRALLAQVLSTSSMADRFFLSTDPLTRKHGPLCG